MSQGRNESHSSPSPPHPLLRHPESLDGCIAMYVCVTLCYCGFICVCGRVRAPVTQPLCECVQVGHFV